jgi:hypothetical protein
MKLKRDFRKLLSPKPFTDFSAAEYRQYCRDLYKKYIGSKTKIPPKTVLINRNKKGSIVFRIRRDEKYLTTEEALIAAKQLEMDLADFEQLCMDRKIPIKEEHIDGQA